LRHRYLPSLEGLDERIMLSGGLTGSATPTGYAPQQIRHAYGTDQVPLDGTGQTIAVVVAYDDPRLLADVDQFDQQFGLTSGSILYQQYGPASSFLSVVNQTGGSSLPGTDPAGPGTKNWEVTEALEVEWIHATAPAAHIVVFEAASDKVNSGSDSDLFAAVNTARNWPGVTVVCLSWAESEFSGEGSNDGTLTTPSGHAGITFVAPAGDTGSGIMAYPAASPNVLTVGGTVLPLDAQGDYPGTGANGEVAWNGGGGGISQFESQPAYQLGMATQSTSQRVVPDVAYDAGSGFAVYDSYNNNSSSPWDSVGGNNGVGGTGAGSAQWSALIALVNQSRDQAGLGSLEGPTQTLPLVYNLRRPPFRDITGGNVPGVAVGYDTATGLGSPVSSLIVAGLSQPFTTAQGGSALFQLDQANTLWRYTPPPRSARRCQRSRRLDPGPLRHHVLRRQPEQQLPGLPRSERQPVPEHAGADHQ
jgi:subtilase family serine protease